MAPELAVAQPQSGLRGVVLGKMDQPCLNIVASPAASYLLPDLSQMTERLSLGSGETRRPGGWVRIVGNSVIVGRSVREDDLDEQRRWFDLKQMIDRVSAMSAEAAVAAGGSVDDAPPPATATALVVDEAHHTDAIEPLPADASIEAIASRTRELTGLSDAKLAELFKVRRETFNRWRLGAMTNPTEGMRRRVGTVLRLLEELYARGVSINDWLQNPSTVDGATPYDLLRRGRIDEVSYLAAAVGEQGAARAPDTMHEEPLVFEDDGEGWESFAIEVTDDED